MVATQDETGCDAFTATVSFDSGQLGTVFQWGVRADIASAPNSWVIVTEVPDASSSKRYRSFALAENETQDYWFATGRRFGAQKYTQPSAKPGIRFAVWAPAHCHFLLLCATADLSCQGDVPARASSQWTGAVVCLSFSCRLLRYCLSAHTRFTGGEKTKCSRGFSDLRTLSSTGTSTSSAQWRPE